MFRRNSGRREFVEERVELVGVHPAFHPLVVDEHDRRVAAGAEAFALFQRKQTIGTGFVEVDPKLALEMSRCRTRAGVPAVFFGSGESSDYHEPSDTPERIDPEIMQQRARALYEVMIALSNAACDRALVSTAEKPAEMAVPGSVR